ncbi:MAG TPA: discoidin domain-containing protein [Pyrinomonadaceae bacterium]|jgi:F5/8 type C domain.|nr:discoidin domain-containing protein [Pyrinomonadaceae bacterium]
MNSTTSRATKTRSATENYKTSVLHLVFLAVALSLVVSVGACSNKEESVSGPNTNETSASATSANPNRATEKIVISSATGSTSTPNDLPKLAFDGDPKTVWSSGNGVPGWIQIDLGQPTTISKIRLNVSQFPPGPTTHQISAGPTPDSLAPLGTLDGNTTDGQVLELNKSASNVRYLKIETVKSPSWVAWREIEVFK